MSINNHTKINVEPKVPHDIRCSSKKKKKKKVFLKGGILRNVDKLNQTKRMVTN